MTTWADLRRWSDAPLEDAFQEAKHLQAKLEGAGDDLYGAIKGVTSEGHTADALRGALYSLTYDADVAESALTRLMQAFNTAAESVEQIALEVEATDARITENYLVIDESGTVSLSDYALESKTTTLISTAATGELDDTPYAHAYAKRIILQSDVDRILAAARETRQTLKRDLATVVKICSDRTVDAEALGTRDSPISRRDVEQWANRDPAAVRATWESLSKSQQDQLLDNYPDLLGNLAGIPFTVRKLANDQNMQAFVDEASQQLKEVDAEIAQIKDDAAAKQTKDPSGTVWLSPSGPVYTPEQQNRLLELARVREDLIDQRGAAERLLAGDGAVKFDPANDSIIAVNGDLTKNPDTVISYVPGTGTDFSSFANGITDFPEAVVDELKVDRQSAIAFTIKDGSWSTWVGEGANSSPSEMAERGEKVFEFQKLIQMEDYSEDVKTVAKGHSAGMTKLSAAEAQGMVVDEMISDAGSYLVSEWTPNPNTEYTHIQYKNDAINSLDPFMHTPHNSDVFEHKTLEPHINNNPIDGHSRIVQGPETNRPGIVATVDEIKD
ncbi:hypothetical protein [uncultured Gulosibacter sp.]|uniref:hypothetical protein n=1 Tax=uncultured Gulosibacter sp. TaxID=1339167 RepID=UPI00288ACBBF|nr:hypothetical protein [uncultured Gulosibacter sp.]